MNYPSDPAVDVTMRRRRWLVLAVGLAAMAASCAFQAGLPFLIPAFRAEGLTLSQAGVMVACPMFGLMVALIAWGAAADRWGERSALCLGMVISGAALLVAAKMDGPVAMGLWLAIAGVGGASVHAASGRLILGWFEAGERGLAMGVRQAAQPLGVAAAGVVLPPLAAKLGLAAPMLVLAVGCLLMAVLVAVFVRDPPRPPDTEGRRPGTPYGTPVLWRLHASAGLLVVPQFAVATFALVYLVDDHGWAASTAGRVLALSQLCGAVGRIGAGVWSDRAGSRLGPYRLITIVIGTVMIVLAAGAYWNLSAAVAVLLAATVITMSPNGLGYTAVAEYAGHAWAGRALGAQNTVQNALAVLTPPVLGGVVTGSGYAAAFAVAAAFPLVAVALVPVSAEAHPAGAGLSVDGP